MSSPSPVRNQALSQQVADTIRQMILIGKLPPGEEMRLENLAELLAVSTMPVREALLWLSHDGLVEAHRNRSFRVARFNREDIEDIYRTHALLAGEMAARAAARARPELTAELRAIEDQWATAESAALDELNRRFHRGINHAAQSHMLLLFLRNTTRLIPQHFYSRIPEWRAVSRQGHTEVADAIEAKDATTAQAAARQHVMDVGGLLIAHFSDHGYWSAPRPL